MRPAAHWVGVGEGTAQTSKLIDYILAVKMAKGRGSFEFHDSELSKHVIDIQTFLTHSTYALC